MYKSSEIAKLEKTKQTVETVEKEEERLRRVLANRESARQSIHRRQAMYLELSKRSAELSGENENLKKQKELMEGQYNSLKLKNKSLKAQMAKIQKDKPGEKPEGPRLSQAQIRNTASKSNRSHMGNQPQAVPCFRPSVLRPSDVFQRWCTIPPDIMCWSPFSMPRGDMPCMHHGRENS